MQSRTSGLWPGLIGRLSKPLLVTPMIIQWLLLSLRYRSLSLPSAANPAIELGGLVGESKLVYFQQVRPAQQPWLARIVAVAIAPHANTTARNVLSDAGLSFPVIAKPDIGWCGFGVRRLDDFGALDDYIADYPAGETLLLQEYVDLPGEAGLFYLRWPGEARGRLLSLTVREPPTVKGDGTQTFRELVAQDPFLQNRMALYDGLDTTPASGEATPLAAVWSHRMGGRYRDRSEALTPALEAAVDAIACGMPDFHIGRFDVRFTDLAALGRGAFKVLEINGAGSEAINFFDEDMPFFAAYRGVLGKTAMLFRLAARNRAAGAKPCGWWALQKAFRRQHRLLGLYPAAN
jgi:hypothetical protein